MLSISQSLLSQTISGKVRDLESGEALIGANVFVAEDPSVGTVTDLEGKFTLEISDSHKKLTFTYVGYKSLTVDINGRTEINVSLSSGTTLDEAVVIGYGSIEREDVTGSVQTVDSRDFNKGAITSSQDLIAGKVAGVSVINGGGGPDEGAQVRIRGLSSLDANNEPLYVVDGVPLASGGIAGNRNPLNIINPQDIENITVLKDASATAIYGSRASAGVILITTKKGSFEDDKRINYTGNVSFGNPINTVDVLSADEFRNTMMEQEPDPERLALIGDANTDWQDEIYQTAIGTDHNLSLSDAVGGFLPYRVSIGYTDKDGILLNDNFKRYSAGINLSPQFFNNSLQVNVNFRGMRTENTFADRGAIGAALSYDPTRPIFDEESQYSGYSAWTLENGNPNNLAPVNPLSLLDQNLRQDESVVSRYIVNGTLDYRLPFLPNLRANLNLGYDYSNGDGFTRIVGDNKVAYSFDEINGGGLDNTYDETRTNEVLEFYLNYKESFGQHTFDAMAGYSWQRFFDESSFRNSDAAGTPEITVEQNEIGRELYLLSYYSRLNYNYDRLLLTATIRADATSRFAPENRWGLFPAAATAFKLIDNKNKFFNKLKIRAGWGVTGQQEVGGYYLYQPIYEASLDNARYPLGNSFLNTLRPNGYDRNIKWEETTTWNAGIDFGIIENRLSGTLDVYRRDTRDLLGLVDVPAGTNLTNRIFTNVGDMVSEGIEFALQTTPIYNNNMRWDLGVNYTYNINEITNLTATNDPDFQGVERGGIAGGVGANIQIHTVGFEPFSFFVFEQKYDEDGKIIEGEFVDRNGDGTVNAEDKYRLESPLPRHILGVTSNYTYKSFDFSFALRAHFGNYVYNNVETNLGNYDLLYHPTNYLSNIHRSAIENDIQNQANVTFSDAFVSKATFFRMDHMTIGYTFNELIGESLRVFATLQNAFVITAYDGLDPEITNGIDNNFYPRPRTIVFGVSANF
jgi:iron complex outermembrane receptor protein